MINNDGINYDGRRFRPVGHGADAPVATYRQRDDLLWADFSGGNARRGSLTGVCTPDGRLRFAYTMVLDGGEIISGYCESTPEVLADGRIRLHETWQRYGANATSGTSQIEEVPPQS
jgi:hypothetical protein